MDYLGFVLFFTNKPLKQRSFKVAEQLTPIISFNPTIVADPAGKIALKKFEEQYSREFKTIKKRVPEIVFEHELNRSVRELLLRVWGLHVVCPGTKSIIVTVQTPIIAALRAGNSKASLRSAYKIYRKDVNWQQLTAVQKIKLYEEKAAQNQSIKTGAVPSDFSLIRSVTRSPGGMDMFEDTNLIHEHVYIYRLYINNTQYIEQIIHYLTVRPSITSFTGVVTPSERKVVFDFDVENTTSVAIYKNGSSTPLRSAVEDCDVSTETYTYTLEATNDWGRKSSKTITVRCNDMALSKPALSAVVDSAYIRSRLSWGVQANVLDYEINRFKVAGSRRYNDGEVDATYENGSCYDSNVERGNKYVYQLKVKNAWSNMASDAVPVTMEGNPPAVPSITNLSTDRNAKVTVRYSRPNNTLSYKIYRTINEQETLVGTPSTISFVDSSVPRNRDVSYAVSACNEWGDSDKSEPKQIFSYVCADNEIKRRALCFASSGDERLRYSCDEMAKAFEHNGIVAESRQSEYSDFVQKFIFDRFNGFDADDCPIIMFSVFCNSNSIEFATRSDRNASISLVDLKKILDKVPGHKILLIDAHFRGNSRSAELQRLDFSRNVRRIFAARGGRMNAETALQDVAPSPDYSIICGMSVDSENRLPATEYHYVPYWWGEGIGWNMSVVREDGRPCRHYADTNGNKEITMAELTEYSRAQLANSSANFISVFRWTSNEGRVIVTYTGR